MLEAVLFDLDGTLLDIDLQLFLREYFEALGPIVAGVTEGTASTALEAVMDATGAMCEPHTGVSNRDVFNARFMELTGADLMRPSAAAELDRFYSEEFPHLKGSHGPRVGGSAAVSAARELGLKTALATNPIFPRAAIVERLRWAELDASDFDLITSYETAEACKPLPRYFRQIAEQLDVSPAACLMVGDDPSLDLAAADVGMRTFMVGDAPVGSPDWRGTLGELAGLLGRLAV